MKSEKAPRTYRLGARAEAAAATGARILAAAYEAFAARDYDAITLAAIAEAAGVTLQTVLRRFGSKERLFAAVGEAKAAEIFAARTPAAPGDVDAAIAALLASYEAMGDVNWRLLCQAERRPVLGAILARARAGHRVWVEATFAAALGSPAGPAREALADQLFAATDFYVWRLLRRDLGRSAAATHAHVRATVDALVGAAGARRAEA